jgi:tRNA dimethylallyltransferase
MSRPLFALVGATASGKTGLAIALAKRFPIEIISMDSALVYQGMNIGTAKPTQEEQDGVPHHLMDRISPLESYSAAQFVEEAQAAIDAIESRGNIPLLVGGTFLYLNALIHGLSQLPASDPNYRLYLEEEARTLGWDALHQRLATLDPSTAQRIAPADRQRIQRALEIIYLTGRPMSDSLQTRHSSLKHTPQLMGLDCERTVLHQRIHQRFHQMVQAGLLDELQQLKREYPTLLHDSTAMRCVGYRQAWDHLEGLLSASEWIERGIIATRQLAKRQVTWMRHFPETPIHTFATNNPQVIEKLADFISKQLQS